MTCLAEATNVYFAFLDHLNAAAVHYAVLHSWESLRVGDVSDIDMVVATEDLGRLEACFREHYCILNLLHYEASSFGFVLAPKNDLAHVFVADVSTDYRWDGRIFFTDQELLQNRQLWNGYWIAGAAQEFAYLLVKKIYEKGSFPEHQRVRIGERARELDTEARLVLSNLLAPRWAAWVLDRIARDEWVDLEACVPELRRSMRFQILKRDHLNLIRYWVAEIERYWERWRYPTGATIAIVGGKGTFNRTFTDSLRAGLHNVFRRVIVAGPRRALGSKQVFRDRALLSRSTLIFRECSLDDLSRHCTRRRKGSRFAPILTSCPDLVFIIGSERSSLPKCGLGTNTADVPHELNSPMPALTPELNIAILDGQLPLETIVRNAYEITARFLMKRYLQRRQIWFSN